MVDPTLARPKRRARIYWASEDEVWELLRARWDIHPIMLLYFLEGVPADCKVERVFHFPERKAFGFYLTHPTFDPVPVGQHPPSAGEVRYEAVQVRLMPGEAGAAAGAHYPAYHALRAENERLRGILSDLREDSPRLKAMYEQGRAEEREAAARRARARAAYCRLNGTDLENRFGDDASAEACEMVARDIEEGYDAP